jgi:hypothetical protein
MDTLGSYLLQYPKIAGDIQLYLNFFKLADKQDLISDDSRVTPYGYHQALASISYTSPYVAILQTLRRASVFVNGPYMNRDSFLALMNNVEGLPSLPDPPKDVTFIALVRGLYELIGRPTTSQELLERSGNIGVREDFQKLLIGIYNFDRDTPMTEDRFVHHAYVVSKTLNLVQLDKAPPIKPAKMSQEDYMKFSKLFEDLTSDETGSGTRVLSDIERTGYVAAYLYDPRHEHQEEIRLLEKLKLPLDEDQFLEQISVLQNEVLPPVVVQPHPKIPERLMITKPAGLTAEQFEFFMDIWDALDTDKDGLVSREQFQSMNYADTVLQKMLNDCPVQLTLAEFLQLAVQNENRVEIMQNKKVFTQEFLEALQQSYVGL